MQRHIRTRAAIVTVALVAAGAVTVTVGVSQAAPEHKPKPAAATYAQKASKAEIASLFDGWNAALQTGDAEIVADRYAREAVLLPTASPEIRTNRAQIVDYFEYFLKKKPKGEKIRSVVNVLDNDSAIDAGLYVFTLTDPKTGEKKDVEARYTYEYEKRGGKWLVVNHHSSVLPAAS